MRRPVDQCASRVLGARTPTRKLMRAAARLALRPSTLVAASFYRGAHDATTRRRVTPHRPFARGREYFEVRAQVPVRRP
jgi:hypothetical protein